MSQEKRKLGAGIGKFASNLGKKTADLAASAGSAAADVGAKAQNTLKNTGNITGDLASKAKQSLTSSKDAVANALDVNGDGTVDIEDIIIMGMRVPGIRISREEFLRKELIKNYPEQIIEDAIAYNPAHAGISVEDVDKIANEVIQYERNCVSGISAALGMPGGVAMAATIPADIAQYYGYMLRATQKLLYLYGFPEIDTKEQGQTFDTETLNILTLCLGVMYGAAGANNAIKGIAKALASGVEKQLMRKALTKGTIYPIVKSVSKWFSVKMTKEVFAGFFKKAIPVVGGLIGGGLTYVTFKPCCDKLKNSLRDTLLANPDAAEEENDIVDVIAEDIANDKDIDHETLESILDKDDIEPEI